MYMEYWQVCTSLNLLHCGHHNYHFLPPLLALSLSLSLCVCVCVCMYAYVVGPLSPPVLHQWEAVTGWGSGSNTDLPVSAPAVSGHRRADGAASVQRPLQVRWGWVRWGRESTADEVIMFYVLVYLILSDVHLDLCMLCVLCIISLGTVIIIKALG